MNKKLLIIGLCIFLFLVIINLLRIRESLITIETKIDNLELKCPQQHDIYVPVEVDCTKTLCINLTASDSHTIGKQDYKSKYWE